jgi:hypothetical protein
VLDPMVGKQADQGVGHVLVQQDAQRCLMGWREQTFGV